MFLTGSQISGLEVVLMEHFAPKQRIDLVLSVSGELSDEAIRDIQNHLESSGLDFMSPIKMGYTEDYPHALSMSFRRPYRRKGYAVLQIASYIDDLLSSVGGSITGWRVL